LAAISPQRQTHTQQTRSTRQFVFVPKPKRITRAATFFTSKSIHATFSVLIENCIVWQDFFRTILGLNTINFIDFLKFSDAILNITFFYSFNLIQLGVYMISNAIYENIWVMTLCKKEGGLADILKNSWVF
jgi:hypothetical protein